MKRAIFVRSKTIVMTELDKKIREKEHSEYNKHYKQLY